MGVAPGHAARAVEAQHARIRAGHVLRGDGVGRGDPQVLNDPIVEDGQRLGRVRVDEQDEPAVPARLHAILFVGLRSGRGIFKSIADVELESNREVAAALHSAFHRPEHEALVLEAGVSV